MGIRTLFNKFTAGELDPKFLAEVDYEGYRKGARKLRNVITLPQGAAQRRFGTHYEDVIQDAGQNITDESLVKMIGFEYLSNEKYWLIIRPNGLAAVAIDIYLDDVLQTTVSPVGTYLPADIQFIRWTEDINKLYLFHEDYPTRLIQRGNASNVWTDMLAIFTFYPAADFSFIDNPTNNYANNGTTFTPNNVNATTITASTAVFTSNHAGIAPNGGGIFVGNGGVFRIVSVNAAGTVATGFTTDEFVDTSAIKGSLAFLGERAWNDGSVIGAAPAGVNRGFPKHGNFFQQRLVLGGSKALPGSAYASEVKDYLNFNNSDNDPASGWGVEAGVTGTDTIQDIMSTKSLVLLTDKGTSATSILLDLPTTPTNVFLNTQGTEGSRDMDGAILNNQIIYGDRAGNTIWAMTYDIPDSGYSVSNASILSSHLIRNPQWADIFDPDNVDGRYYCLINADGTLALYNSILEENIKAWTLADTLGDFVDIACLGNQAKVLTKRQITTGNGGVVNGPLQAIYKVDGTFNVFRNITASINDGSGTEIMASDEDYILIGNEIQFTRLRITFSTPASENLGLTFEFLTLNSSNNPVWELFIPDDLSDGFTTNFGVSWDISDVSNWEPQPILETDTTYGDYPVYYWIRIRRNNPNTLTNPTISTMFLNTESVIYMEKLDFNIYMDAQLDTVADNSGFVTGLEHLIGQDAYVFANGFPLGVRYINETGTLQTDEPDADIMIGLDYKTNITPMPVIALLQNGYSIYEPTKVETMYIEFYKSLGLVVDGQNIPQVNPGQFITDEAPVPVTDVYKIPPFGGWDPRFPFVITQSYPAPMTILGLSYTIEVSA